MIYIARRGSQFLQCLRVLVLSGIKNPRLQVLRSFHILHNYPKHVRRFLTPPAIDAQSAETTAFD